MNHSRKKKFAVLFQLRACLYVACVFTTFAHYFKCNMFTFLYPGFHVYIKIFINFVLFRIGK